MWTEADDAVIAAAVNKYVESTALLEKVEHCRRLASAIDTALKLIETDPHQWSARPCQTCAAVSLLIGRPFGCHTKSGK